MTPLDPTRPDRSFRRAWRLSAAILGLGALTTVIASLSRPVEPLDPAEDHNPRAALRIETDEELLAPVLLEDRSFTIAVRKQRLAWPENADFRFDPDDHETAVSFEIRDAGGRTLYDYRVVDDLRELEPARVRSAERFLFSYQVHACVLEGSSGKALMVDWYFFPSAPSACSTHVILGLVDDELVPFGEPFCENLESPRVATASRWKLRALDGEELLEIRLRSPFFSLVAPVAIDFRAGRLLPSRRCTRQPDVDLCEVPARADRDAGEQETRLRLFPFPDLAATPARLALKPSSDVQFLSALAPDLFDDQGRWSPPADPEQSFWLRVRVDGREGWVLEEVDLLALGLHAAG